MTPKRMQRERTKGWKMPPNSRYVGRGTQWGNPYKVVRYGGGKYRVIGDNYESFPMSRQGAHRLAAMNYEIYILNNIDIEPLRGLDYILCFCPPDLPCHCDAIIERLDTPAERE